MLKNTSLADQVFVKEVLSHADAKEEITTLRQQVKDMEADVKRAKYRLSKIIPLLQEARDALPVISLASAKLHNVSLTLGDRMDEVGTMTKEAIDQAIANEKGE